MPQDPIVEIENVAFAYEAARPVLSEVDLAIPRGAVVGIMGQSGCGKTTLLRIIMGALAPTAGSARVLGHDTRSLGRDELYAMRRKMGMLFQFGALFTDMTVFQNVAFPLRELDRRQATNRTGFGKRGLVVGGGTRRCHRSSMRE